MFSHDQYQALQRGAGLLDRRARGRLELTGADRRGYLHGLLTNDILALTPGMGCYAALLTPQGRMISDMRVSEIGDRLLVDLPEATAEGVRQRFADFIFTEDVEVRDVRDSLRQIGVYGPQAAAVLSQSIAASHTSEVLEAMSLGANRELSLDAGRVVVVKSDDYGIAGFETFASSSEADRWATALRAAGAVDVDAATVEVTRVEAGRPEFGVDMDEHTIPLEAGIEDRAISQTKGCYVGQEVIVRVLHRGQGRVAKRLVGLVASDSAPLTRGLRLEADGKSTGTITSAIWSPRVGRSIGLGYVQRDFAEPGRIVHVVTDADGSHPATVVMLARQSAAREGGAPFVPPAAE